MDVLRIVVLALYGACTTLVLMVLMRHGLDWRRERRHQRRMKRQRPLFEAYVLSSTPLPRTSQQTPAVLLDLGLRYAAIVRGSEAQRIVDCLEERGIIDELLARLRARSAWSRAEAAHSLGRLRIDRAVPGLISALNDQHEDVRTE